MNSSLSSADWDLQDESLPSASQMFHQIEETIAKSRKVVEDSVALSRTNSGRREQLQERFRSFPVLPEGESQLHTPQKSASREDVSLPSPHTDESSPRSSQWTQLKQEENLRMEHERMIVQLKNKVGVLESQRTALAQTPKNSTLANLHRRWEVAERQKTQFLEEGEQLRSVIEDLQLVNEQEKESLSDLELEKQVHTLSQELKDVLTDNARLLQELAKAKEQARKQDEAGRKLRELEGKMRVFESAYAAQVTLNHDLSSKLLRSQPKSKALLQEVGLQISEQDNKVDSLDQRLEDAEKECERLQEMMSEPEISEIQTSVVRKDSENSAKALLKKSKHIRKKRTKETESGKLSNTSKKSHKKKLA